MTMRGVLVFIEKIILFTEKADGAILYRICDYAYINKVISDGFKFNSGKNIPLIISVTNFLAFLRKKGAVESASCDDIRTIYSMK